MSSTGGVLELLQMLQISDSLFPIGAYTLSNGLETFVELGKLKNIDDLRAYLASYMELLPYNDLGYWCLAYRHAEEAHFIRELDAYSLALKAPSEVRKGCIKLCRSFFKVWEKTSQTENDNSVQENNRLNTQKDNQVKELENVDSYRAMVKDGNCRGNFSVASGLYAHDIGLDIKSAASIYAYSLINAIVVCAVKTVPLSHIKGQAVLREALEKIPDIVEKAVTAEMDDLGVGGTEFDIFCMNHEYLYTKQYMS